MTTPPSDQSAFLAPLARLAARHPDLEALVFWENAGWPDLPAEEMDTGEVAFYAEGLILEGFHLDWRLFADPVAPQTADALVLYVWEAGATLPPDPAPDLPLLQRGRWPAA